MSKNGPYQSFIDAAIAEEMRTASIQSLMKNTQMLGRHSAIERALEGMNVGDRVVPVTQPVTAFYGTIVEKNVRTGTIAVRLADGTIIQRQAQDMVVAVPAPIGNTPTSAPKVIHPSMASNRVAGPPEPVETGVPGMFETLQDVLAHKFVGNHFADSEAFNAIDGFALEAYEKGRVADAIAALNHIISAGMGEPDAIIKTRAELDEAIEEMIGVKVASTRVASDMSRGICFCKKCVDQINRGNVQPGEIGGADDIEFSDDAVYEGTEKCALCGTTKRGERTGAWARWSSRTAAAPIVEERAIVAAQNAQKAVNALYQAEANAESNMAIAFDLILEASNTSGAGVGRANEIMTETLRHYHRAYDNFTRTRETLQKI